MQTSEVLPIYYHLIYILMLLEVYHQKLCQFCYGTQGMLGYGTVLTGK